jgi:hypothetical protein
MSVKGFARFASEVVFGAASAFFAFVGLLVDVFFVVAIKILSAAC